MTLEIEEDMLIPCPSCGTWKNSSAWDKYCTECGETLAALRVKTRKANVPKPRIDDAWAEETQRFLMGM